MIYRTRYETRYDRPAPILRSAALYENHRDFLYQPLTLADLVGGGDPRFVTIKAVLYFLFLPYLTGIVVMMTIFMRGHLSDAWMILLHGDAIHFFMMWAVGYEVLASIFLSWAFYTILQLKRYTVRLR